MLSAYFVGTMVTPLIGAVVATRFGAKPLLMVSAAGLATADVVCVTFGTSALSVLLAARVAVGIDIFLLFHFSHAPLT